MWIYYNAKLECDKFNESMLKYSPWSGHRSFGYDLIANIQPKIVVELGSFYGCSTFTFAQAIKDLNLSTVLWSIDLWEEFDEYTQDDYKKDIYNAFKQIRDSCYDKKYIEMLKMTFDQARDQFANSSVDILHIDGSHFYEDVKHDFESWLPKLKENGIILFHDVSDDEINGDKMGSYYFWKELEEIYPYHCLFDFSCGLGLIFLSEKIYNQFLAEVDLEYYQKINNRLSTKYKDQLRKDYFLFLDKEYHIQELMKQLKIKEQHIKAYADDKKARELFVETIELDRKNLYKAIADYKKTEIDRTNYICQLESLLERKEDYLKELELLDGQKDKALHDYHNDTEIRVMYINNLENLIEEKDDYIQHLEKSQIEKNEALKKYYDDSETRVKYIAHLESILHEKDLALKKYDEDQKVRNDYIKELEEKLGKA